MKRLKKISLLLLFTVALSASFYSCEDSVADAVCNADAELAAYQAALTAFSANPTQTTCNNLKSAASDLISAATRCGGGIDISGAQNAIDNIDCSVF